MVTFSVDGSPILRTQRGTFVGMPLGLGASPESTHNKHQEETAAKDYIVLLDPISRIQLAGLPQVVLVAQLARRFNAPMTWMATCTGTIRCDRAVCPTQGFNCKRAQACPRTEPALDKLTSIANHMPIS